MILYSQVDFETETKRLTGNRGVDVVYDSSAKPPSTKAWPYYGRGATWCYLAPPAAPYLPVDPNVLMKGSLYLTRPSLVHYAAERKELEARAQDIFGMIAAGKLKLRFSTYPLAAVQQAHRDLEGRKTTGKLLLLP